MSHDEELHFLRAEQHSHLFRLLLGLTVLAGLLVYGISSYTKHRQAVQKAEAADAAERQWLVKTVDRIGQMRVVLNDATTRVETIVAANSKPVRKGGKAVPQEKWSEEQAAEYRMAQDNLLLVSNALDKLADDYNKRRSAYTGKWPNGAEPPPTLKGSKK